MPPPPNLSQLQGHRNIELNPREGMSGQEEGGWGKKVSFSVLVRYQAYFMTPEEILGAALHGPLSLGKERRLGEAEGRSWAG